MTPFTDEDLKRLKEMLLTYPYGDLPHVEDLEALLSRLEAAENLAALATHRCGMGETQVFCDCGLIDLNNAWRKVCGK